MIGIDFLGPINPECSQTGSKYVLLAVDYFSRFTWAWPYRACGMAEVAHFLCNHLTPTFGWPKAVYSDNGSHFVGKDITNLFRLHGVTHFTAPVTHPSSVGLIERNVQMMMSQIRKRSIESGIDHPTWANYVTEATIAMNTRLIRIHGYSPAAILLGFTPTLLHLGMIPAEPVNEGDLDDLPAHQYQLAETLQSERRELAMWALTSHQTKTESKRRQGRYLPKQGDLVLVRDKVLDGQRGRKLDPKWRGPRLVVSVSGHGLSASVKELYGEGRARRYHIDDLKPYVTREDRKQEEGPIPTVRTNRDAMTHAGFAGERAVFLLQETC
jgi:hypothetical protein